MQVPLLDLRAQYAGLRDEIRRAMDAVCDEQRFVLGPTVERFEARMAAYCGVRHALGVSSGTDALLVALMALGVGPGDGVVTTPYSFFATLGCIVRLGAVPLLADIDPGTYNIDPRSAAALLADPPARFRGVTPRVLLPAHLFGQAADMDPLRALAREHGLRVVEDACQAVGAEYPGGGRAGAMGDAGCLSFFPSKNLGGFGDGGMVLTNDAGLYERMRRLRNHGMEPKYRHELVGGNFRLDALQAAVLDVKLSRLDEWHAGRRRRAARYDAALAGTAIGAPEARYRDSGLANFHTYNQYVVRASGRDARRRRLERAGIGCEVYYPVPLHLQPCFARLGYRAGDFPHSERAAAETLALPVYAELTDAMQDCVVDHLTASGD
ncbi:MAG: DegT/DnrJ/EryC1/StrS family aminotransferase [Lentisphaerae bacterium]|nr:DegT/DnrJ/EryC1/StrS family aminotransferase [Lentisphaerota bacterium]